MQRSEKMGGIMIAVDPRKGSEAGESPQRNLVKDGPRELLKQKIENMQTRVAEKKALKNVQQFEQNFLKLAQRYFDFDSREYTDLSRGEKEALLEMVQSAAQRKMGSWLGGNCIFVGGIVGLSFALSPFFLCGLIFLLFNIPFVFETFNDEIDFFACKKYAGLLFSRYDKNKDGT